MGSSIGKLDATILELVGWAVSTIFFLVKLSTLLSSWMANSSEPVFPIWLKQVMR